MEDNSHTHTHARARAHTHTKSGSSSSPIEAATRPNGRPVSVEPSHRTTMSDMSRVGKNCSSRPSSSATNGSRSSSRPPVKNIRTFVPASLAQMSTRIQHEAETVQHRLQSVLQSDPRVQRAQQAQTENIAHASWKASQDIHRMNRAVRKVDVSM